MCQYINNILPKLSSNEVTKLIWLKQKSDQQMFSVIGTAESEAISPSHYVFINFQVMKFIVAMCMLSFFFCYLTKISCYKR